MKRSRKYIKENAEEKFQCLGKIKDKRWYDLILDWIVKFEQEKDENGWVWAKVDPYKPELIDEREFNQKEYIYVGERRKIVAEDIIDKVKKGILVPSNSKNGVPVILNEEDNIYTGKKDYRVCSNLVAFNKKIKPIQYPGVKSERDSG